MIEYHFRVPNTAVFTLYSYSKALEYRFKVPSAGSLREKEHHQMEHHMAKRTKVE
jgi:S-ribosylhomocysteine lyase LuxS involved in autoinducer biosynthesis